MCLLGDPSTFDAFAKFLNQLGPPRLTDLPEGFEMSLDPRAWEGRVVASLKMTIDQGYPTIGGNVQSAFITAREWWEPQPFSGSFDPGVERVSAAPSEVQTNSNLDSFRLAGIETRVL